MKKQVLRLSAAITLVILNFLTVVAIDPLTIDPNPIESMVVPYLTSPITIDGIADASYPVAFELTKVLTFTSGEFNGVTDHQVYITMGWRDEGIYIYADITDDIDKGALNWDQDGIELKINPDKSNDGPTFSWANDAWEIGMERDVTTNFRYWNKNLEAGGNTANGVPVSTGPLNGRPGVAFSIVNEDGHYVIESLIPWLFFLPEGATEDSVPIWRAKEMGFDIHCADNDGTAAGRDHCLIWDMDGDPSSTDADYSNVNTALLGNITFGAKVVSINNFNSTDYKVYPNPATDIINFDNLNDVISVEVVNLFGQSVRVIEVNSASMTTNISGLNSGVYFVKFINSNNKTNSIRRLLII